MRFAAQAARRNANSVTSDFKRARGMGERVRAGRAVFQPQEQEPGAVSAGRTLCSL